MPPTRRYVGSFTLYLAPPQERQSIIANLPRQERDHGLLPSGAQTGGAVVAEPEERHHSTRGPAGRKACRKDRYRTRLRHAPPSPPAARFRRSASLHGARAGVALRSNGQRRQDRRRYLQRDRGTFAPWQTCHRLGAKASSHWRRGYDEPATVWRAAGCLDAGPLATQSLPLQLCACCNARTTLTLQDNRGQ